MQKEKWFYDYANKCDCSDDDRCGCTFPNNMKRNYDYELETAEDTQAKTVESEVKQEKIHSVLLQKPQNKDEIRLPEWKTTTEPVYQKPEQSQAYTD